MRRLSLILGSLPLVSVAWARPLPPAHPSPTVAILSTDAGLVAAQTGWQVFVFDRASGKRLASFRSVDAFRGALAPGALATVSENKLTVWRGPRYARPVRLKAPKVLPRGRTAISADGRIVTAMYAKDGGVGDQDTVGVFDAVSGAKRAQITLEPKGRVQGVTLSDDGRLIAIFADIPPEGGAVLEVHRLSAKGAKRLWRWQERKDRTTYCAAFAPGGRILGLCAGKRLLLWDVPSKRIVAQAPAEAIRELFPPRLRPMVQVPGVHGLVFKHDGKELVTVHGFGVVGVARWSVRPLKPTLWIKRPPRGGTMRQLAWDRAGKLWLVTSSYAPEVTVHVQKGDHFEEARVLDTEPPAPPKPAKPARR